MGLIAVDQRWSKQPPNDPAPLAPWTSFDVAARQPGVTLNREGSADRTYGAGGLGWTGTGSAGAWIVHSGPKSGASTVETQVIACMFSSTTASGSLVTLGVSGNSFGGYFMIQHNAGGLSVAVDDAANSSGGNHISSENFLDGKVHCAVAMHRTDGSSSLRRLWVDGRLIVTGTVGGYSATTYDRFGVCMLRRAASGSHAGSGNRVYAGLYAKGLTEEQAQALSAQGLWAGAYPPRRILVPVGAASGSSALAGALQADDVLPAGGLTGASSGNLSGAPTADDVAVSGSLGGGGPSALTGSVQLDDAAPSGTLAGASPGTLSGAPQLDDVAAGGGLAGVNTSTLSGGVQLDDVAPGGGLSGPSSGVLSGGVQLDAAAPAGGLTGVTTSNLAGAVQLDDAAPAGNLAGGGISSLSSGVQLDDAQPGGTLAGAPAGALGGAVDVSPVAPAGSLGGGSPSAVAGDIGLDAVAPGGALVGVTGGAVGGAVALDAVAPDGAFLGDTSTALSRGVRVVDLPALGELARTIYVASDMNREPTLLDDVLVDEADTVTFPVARALHEGEALASGFAITCVYHQGRPDADAALRVATAYQVVAGNVVQLITGAQADTWYLIKGKFPLTSGRVLVGRGIFKGRA